VGAKKRTVLKKKRGSRRVAKPGGNRIICAEAEKKRELAGVLGDLRLGGTPK